MSNTLLEGRVSFVNHDKKYIIIEYTEKGRKKTVNARLSDLKQHKKRVFHIGDAVQFTVELSAKGDKMIAGHVKFLYNNALDDLLNKARTANSFTGYLKVVDDGYFVKEINSYLFLPVNLSPWQQKPAAANLNDTVTFCIENPQKKDKLTAILPTLKFIPEYYAAERAFKKKEPIEADITKVSPHGVYVAIFGGTINAKIPRHAAGLPPKPEPGQHLTIRITFLNTSKIVVEPAL